MKRFVIIALLVLLVGGNSWLVFRQHRLEQDLESLRAENARLTQEYAQRPVLSADELRATTKRLESAQAFMDAVEGRLTNASMLLGQLQAASQNFTATAQPRFVPGATRFGGPNPGYSQPATGWPLVEAPPHPPVSSHGPDGKLLQRSWGPEQLVGPPNTHQAGDIPTAWAPLSSQGGRDEWLHVNYDRAVDISEIRVRETYNPGAIAKLAAVLPDGQEVVIWEGVTPQTEAPVDTSFSAPAGLQAQSVKIYLDRTRAQGWNEIDAVELVGRDGTRQWASSATASTSYADPSRR
jgi:hypothetical protein